MTTEEKMSAASKQSMESRARRYELQETARWILMEEGKSKSPTQYAADYHRTCKCLRVPTGLTKIHRERSKGKTFYSGLVTCGSVWVCAPCSSKVQERRRLEIEKAVNWAYANKFKMVMITLTFPHNRFQKLVWLIAQQAIALRRLRSGKAWMEIKQKIGFQGLIRSLEVTHGYENGFHCHTHELWAVRLDADADSIIAMVREKWAQACVLANLLDPTDKNQVLAFQQRSIDIIDFASTSNYLAKYADGIVWGIDAEIAKGSQKLGFGKNKHPFQLLETATPFNADGRTFAEFASAMAGRRQIFWSPGLHSKVELQSITDEEIVMEHREPADVLAILTRAQWDVVIAEDARCEILDIAQSRGFEGVQDWFFRRGVTLDSEDRFAA